MLSSSCLMVFCRRFLSSGTRMELSDVVNRLQKLASPKLAEKWDNVGLLVEPSPPHTVAKLLLTNDLTETVTREAVDENADMILSYHPPIFQPMKRLLQTSWKERIVIKCLENRIAVYSPHTSYDALDGGVNDWLVSPFGGEVRPLSTAVDLEFPTRGDCSVTVRVSKELADSVEHSLAALSDVRVQGRIVLDKGDSYLLALNSTEEALSPIVAAIRSFDGVLESTEIVKLSKPPLPRHGMGRLSVLPEPLTLRQCIKLIKGHLGLDHVRLALAVGHSMDSEIRTIAACAGSGASVLAESAADLFLTGEMSHHDVLNANHKGASVVLCEHSNTERGFLSVLQQRLHKVFDGQVVICISARDKDPLNVV